MPLAKLPVSKKGGVVCSSLFGFMLFSRLSDGLLLHFLPQSQPNPNPQPDLNHHSYPHQYAHADFNRDVDSDDDPNAHHHFDTYHNTDTNHHSHTDVRLPRCDGLDASSLSLRAS